ncbi:MAG: bifunctional riboflavin kinase/FAD synthetase [Pirellulaceae bacterium]|nr:bifunctional riboflavin kinase/FAD synthetase [Pirellulaceae bacterium]
MIGLFRDLADVPAHLQRGAVAVGNFDGVHRGHARLIEHLVKLANRMGGPAVVMTFDPPPIAILQPERKLHPPLTPLARRAELVGQLGVDGLIVLPTSPELLKLSPSEFFRQVLVDTLQASGIVEGPNFRFGKDRAGDTNLLHQLCNDRGIELQIVSAENDGAGMISSTRIRQLLIAGDVAAANSMLTQPFRLSGRVEPGAGRGRQLLVPTANLVGVESIIPAHGVYGGSVSLEGRSHRVAVNIGPNPTFNDQQSKIEVHVLDWHGDLYGRSLNCDLLTRIRSVLRFDSVDALMKQIQSDILHVQQTVLLPSTF